MQIKALFLTVTFSFCAIHNADAQSQTAKNELPSNQDTSVIVADQYTVFFKEPAQGTSPIVWKANREESLSRVIAVPFGEHSTGQSIQELEQELRLEGEILSILDAINAITVRASEEEAKRLSSHPDVLLVEQVVVSTLDATQSNPKWSLDRLDEQYPDVGDNSYNYTYTGDGQTIYILDSGLDVGESFVSSEFGSRAALFHDFNGTIGQSGPYGPYGHDCKGHGTVVASLAGGSTFGIAKEATLNIVKVTDDTNQCSGTEYPSAIADSLNWLAANAPAGTIVNISFGSSVTCSGWQAQDNAKRLAIIAAAQAGVMVFTSAGNINCSVDDINWKSIPEVFTVGGLQADHVWNPFVPSDEDRKWASSNYGDSVSTWAPSHYVQALSDDDDFYCDPANCGRSGTSFASPLVAGIAAVACEATYPDCTVYSVTDMFDAFRASGTNGTVFETNGSTLTSSPSRVVWQQW